MKLLKTTNIMFNLIATVVEETVTGHFGTKTLRTRMRHFSTVSRHFCTINVVRDTSASDLQNVRTFWTQDNSDKTQLHR